MLTPKPKLRELMCEDRPSLLEKLNFINPRSPMSGSTAASTFDEVSFAERLEQLAIDILNSESDS